jgi:hypothetical protein
MASDGKGRPWRILFGLTFFVLGPCLLVWSLVSLNRTRNFLRGSESAAATVIQMNEIRSFNQTRRSYAPVFAFTASDGRTYTLTSNMASNPPAFKVGEHVLAHYQAGHPEKARLDSFAQLWLLDLIDGVFGIIFTLLMVAVIFARKGEPRVYKRSDFPPAGMR